jgi:hypothetical protein
MLQWISRGWATVRGHALLSASLVIVGFLSGYIYQSSGAADLQPGRGTKSYGATAYRALTHIQLKQKAADLVVLLRSFIKAANNEQADLRLACDKEMVKGNTEERNGQIRKRCNDDSARLSQRQIATYNERYKADAILLREEILQRLPGEYRAKIAAPMLWEFPQNTLGCELIVTSLELIGKSLPDRQSP